MIIEPLKEIKDDYELSRRDELICKRATRPDNSLLIIVDNEV